MPAAVVLVLLTNVIDVLGSAELKGASERARRGRSDGDEDKREEKSWHRHHHRLSPRAASFLCGAAHVPPSLLRPLSFALIVVGGRRRSTPFVGGEEEEEGAAWCLLRRCQHPRFPPLTIDGRSEVISPNTPIEAPCEPMLGRKD